MPTIKRTITEKISRSQDGGLTHFCCEALKSSFRKDYGARMVYGSLIMGNDELNYCPFCGEKVIYDDTLILPEGYRRV